LSYNPVHSGNVLLRDEELAGGYDIWQTATVITAANDDATLIVTLEMIDIKPA